MQDRELSVARLTPAISNERRIVACLYSVVFTAELLVNTRRKSLVKQPVVVRDSDHRIPPSSGGRNLVDDTRARESRFVRGRRKEGRFVVGANDPLLGRVAFYRGDRIGIATSMLFNLAIRLLYIRYIIVHVSTVRKYRPIRCLVSGNLCRDLFSICGSFEAKGTSICQFVGSILKKDSKGNIWLVNIWSRRDNVIDSRLKHRRQNTFVT